MGTGQAVLYRIEPGVKIHRCKIQTPPGKQFEVRAEAFKRIEAALREAGIHFAEVGPRFVLHGPTEPSSTLPARQEPAQQGPTAVRG